MFSCNWINRMLIELYHTKFTSVSRKCSQRKHCGQVRWQPWECGMEGEYEPSLGYRGTKACLIRRHFICFHFGKRWRHFKTVVFWSTWPIFNAVPPEKNISCDKDSQLHGWVSAFPAVCENSWHSCSSELLDGQVKGSWWIGGQSTVKHNR